MSPSSITIRRAAPKATITKKVRILNNYGETFSLDSATSKNGSIRVVKNTIIPNRGYELELEITPPVIENRRKAFTEEFSLGLSNGLQLKVPCYVFYSGANGGATLATKDDCPTCGAKIIDPKTGKVTAFGNPK